MGTLFKYEMRKAFSQKAYWIAIAIMLLVLLANEMTPIITGNFKPKMETENALSGTVIDDEFLANVQPNETGAEDPITFFIKSSTGSTDVTGHAADELYARRTEVNTRLMADAGISEADLQWWLNKDKENVAPFKYTYCTAYSSYLEIAGYINFMLLILAAIGLAGIYADEKSSSMDQLIFCTKNGKKKLFSVKLLVGVIMALFTALVLVLFEIALLTALFGLGGAETYLQIVLPPCMMHINMGQTMIIMSLFFIMESLILSIVAMALSQFTMNHVATIAVMIFVMFMAMMNIPEKLGILYSIWNSIPGSTVGSWMFNDYHLIGHLTNLQFVPIMWLLAGAVLVLAARTSYTRYQVKAR